MIDREPEPISPSGLSPCPPPNPSRAAARAAAALLRAGLLGAWGWGSTTSSGSAPRASPHRGRAGTAEGKARSCILIWLAGGPSHLDTFDPKPDAPADVRGEFKPIDTAVAGLQDQRGLPEAREGDGPA